MFSSIMGTWPAGPCGSHPSFITCTPWPTALGQFALHFEFANLRLVVRVRDGTGTQALADAEGDVVNASAARTVTMVGKMFQIQLAVKILGELGEMIKSQFACPFDKNSVQRNPSELILQ